MTRLLFICKQRNNYGGDNGYKEGSYGLINSCLLVKKAFDELFPNDIESKVVAVVDNNCIDREVHKYKPTHAIIEALWVVPEKFDVLIPLHPSVQWIVRTHSKTPFLANEGIAFDWINRYLELKKRFPHNFHIAGNDYEFAWDMSDAYNKEFAYLPNIYLTDKRFTLPNKLENKKGHIDIGCFGAIRPMKNQMQQAVAAAMYADEMGLKMRFHMNGSRTEQRGDQVLKNIVAFLHGTGHELILHGWYPHHEFVQLVRKMDVGMQVSFSESFNIVAADFVANDVPIIVSEDIRWASCLFKASTTNAEDIKAKLKMAMKWKKWNLQYLNKVGLHAYNYRAVDAWLRFLFPEG